MSKINDGGPAFPGYTMEEAGGAVRIDKLMPGMSLRDYFAAKPLTEVQIGYFDRLTGLVRTSDGWVKPDYLIGMIDALRARAEQAERISELAMLWYRGRIENRELEKGIGAALARTGEVKS